MTHSRAFVVPSFEEDSSFSDKDAIDNDVSFLGAAEAAEVAVRVGLLVELDGTLLSLGKFVIIVVIGSAADLKKLVGRKGKA